MGEQTDRSLLEVEFTHRWYRDFVERLLSDGYRFRGFDADLGAGDAVLRHDVDLSPAAALTMARIEADLGVSATYCLLVSSTLYNPLHREPREQIRRIEALGHDVALHFSTHEYWDGERQPEPDALQNRVAAEQAVLGSVVDDLADVVSFHVPPDWVLGRSFEGVTSTYAPAFFEDCEYVADSGQRWRCDPPRLADADGPVQILTHPGLWGESDGDFDQRVERAIVSSCQRTRRTARAEFIDGRAD